MAPVVNRQAVGALYVLSRSNALGSSFMRAMPCMASEAKMVQESHAPKIEMMSPPEMNAPPQGPTTRSPPRRPC